MAEHNPPTAVGSNAELGGPPPDIVEILRNTPNWLRESYGSWKDCVTQYDRTPFEAADEIERLRTLIAAMRSDISSIAHDNNLQLGDRLQRISARCREQTPNTVVSGERSESARPIVGRRVNEGIGASMLKHWNEEAPPRQTWVAARYDVMEPDHIVKTCKHGCSVIDPLCGAMVLPRYWRLATDEEVRSVLPRLKTPNTLVSGEPASPVQ